MARLKRVVLIVGATLLVGYLLVCTLLFFAQRSMIYPAPKSGAQPRNSQVIHLDGGGLFIYRAPPTAEAPVLIYFHGNADEAAGSEFLADHFPIGLAAVEYPGYGLLAQQGSPSETSINQVAMRAVSYLLTTLKIAPSRLIVSGQSLGSGPAVELASQGIGTRLLLLTPYTSLPDVGARRMPAIPVRLLLLDRFDSAAKASGIEMPVLVIHGTDDEVIPYDLGNKLSTLFPHAELLTIPHGHHNDLWTYPEVNARVARFLAQ